MNQLSDGLRNAMRKWTTGVCIICVQTDDWRHGMTVNSFSSVSLDPPIISVTMENKTRTLQMIGETKTFSLSILNSHQRELSLVFAGKIGDTQNRFVNVKAFTLSGGLIAIDHALAWMECKVMEIIPLENSTLILADVISTQINTGEEDAKPLIYHDRGYHTI